jgi:hypothetical protein
MQTFSHWRCPWCGATTSRDGTTLNSSGLTKYNHLRTHAKEGLLTRDMGGEPGGGGFKLAREYKWAALAPAPAQEGTHE